MTVLHTFRGKKPYSAELFGVYQPLLGWTSARKLRRVNETRARNVDALVGEMLRDHRFAALIDGGIALSGPSSPLLRPDPGWTDPIPEFASVASALRQFAGEKGRLPRGAASGTVIAETHAINDGRGAHGVPGEDGAPPEAADVDGELGGRGDLGPLADMQPLAVHGGIAVYRPIRSLSNAELRGIGGHEHPPDAA